MCLFANLCSRSEHFLSYRLDGQVQESQGLLVGHTKSACRSGSLVVEPLEDLYGQAQILRFGNSDDWLVIIGVVGGSYTPMTADAGYRLRAMVSYSDNTGTGRSATSTPTTPVYQPGTVVLSPDAPKVGEPVTARFSHPESAPED